jgi:hypothetical protein
MTINYNVDKTISSFVARQFPEFYQTDGPNFIAFVQAYYEWLEQSSNTYVGSTTFQSRSLLDNFDVDTTSADFIQHFSDTYLANFPKKLAADPAFVIKHILDFYRSKGTERGFKLLFRILYNLDVDVNIPGKYMFRLSNGTWIIPRYLETSDSPYLNQLAGRQIRSSSGSTAIVETVNKKIVNGRTINILFISGLVGEIHYGELIYCDAIPEMTGSIAPIVMGSLSTVSIENGGGDYRVGDELTVEGSGTDAVARVVAISSENGKVRFALEDGGYGYSLDAAISIDDTGTGGTGSSFKIGDITDVQNINLNVDTINGLKAALMDLTTEGAMVSIKNASMAFSDGEGAIGSAYTRNLQVTILDESSGSMANGESLGNTSLGISNIIVYWADGGQLYCTGLQADLLNANLVPGVSLVSNTNHVLVEVVNAAAVVTTSANGIVLGSGSNTTNLAIHTLNASDFGYYVPGMSITGNVSGATATVVKETRMTDWDYFPVAALGSNLDTPINGAFEYVNKQIGRIAYLTHENPGTGYVAAPEITIVEPLIVQLGISDEQGGIWGNNAVVSATAGSSNGIVTAISVIDSGFGYQSDESLILSNANNDLSVFGKAITLNSGFGRGFWLDTQSFLSDVMVLQDSYYYQVFSYELAVEKMMSAYEKFIKALAHPVGYKMFGKFEVKREFVNSVELTEVANEDSAIRGQPLLRVVPAPKVRPPVNSNVGSSNVGAVIVGSNVHTTPVKFALTTDLGTITADTQEFTGDQQGYFTPGTVDIVTEGGDYIKTEDDEFITTDGSYVFSEDY